MRREKVLSWCLVARLQVSVWLGPALEMRRITAGAQCRVSTALLNPGGAGGEIVLGPDGKGEGLPVGLRQVDQGVGGVGGGVEHDEAQGDAQGGIDHGEHHPAVGLRG